MARARRRVVMGVFLLACVILGAMAPVQADEEPVPAQEADAEIVWVGSLGIAVPGPGETVSFYADLPDGGSERLVIQTRQDGTILINPRTTTTYPWA